MPGYDPRFWELPFDPGDFDAIPEEVLDAPLDMDPERARVRSEVLEGLSELVQTSLTAKQRIMVERYFYDGRTQQEIAAELGVSQQVVSRQLFGVVRHGRRVGGAIQRLRKICVDRGWDPSEWV
jgi:DNA-directed RNA polymerase specialized sigma24 family protein